jgi:hypothetical protein
MGLITLESGSSFRPIMASNPKAHEGGECGCSPDREQKHIVQGNADVLKKPPNHESVRNSKEDCRPLSRSRHPLRSCHRPNRPVLRQITKWNRTSPASLILSELATVENTRIPTDGAETRFPSFVRRQKKVEGLIDIHAIVRSRATTGWTNDASL